MALRARGQGTSQMRRIEWREETVFQPAESCLVAFSQAHGIQSPVIEEGATCTAVFVADKALESVWEHLRADECREQGGVLLGMPYRDMTTNTVFVDVQEALPARGAVGTGVHLQFTIAAWSNISKTISERFPDLVIVGWYHSHPGLGVFMSSTDRASQRAFYNHSWSLSLVVDPHSGEKGWFVGPTCDQKDTVLAYREPDFGRSPEPVAQEQPTGVVRTPSYRVNRHLRSRLSFAVIGLAVGILVWHLLKGRSKARTD